ncbi:hypothetical protein [Streptomyces europaeiscabiei]|uniref:hypothetical protein n=1 Tax=Streptomyces europaeiscabiei TaxID=146819 RepID=UPI002E276531|nr:hypothetical protein OG858_16545 [Streptomyces europaeiscabiei]
MAGTTLDDHAKAGRLYAALRALHLLTTASGSPPGPERLAPKRVPAQLVDSGLESLHKYLVRARAQGGDRWAAVVEVYHEIPELFPAPRVPGTTMSPGEQRSFMEAYEEQLRSYKAKFGKLFPTE